LEEANLVNTVIEKERHNQGKIDKVEKREEKNKTFRRNRQSGKERKREKKLLREIDKVEKREREKKTFR
jgi:hypothetical protein